MSYLQREQIDFTNNRKEFYVFFMEVQQDKPLRVETHSDGNVNIMATKDEI